MNGVANVTKRDLSQLTCEVWTVFSQGERYRSRDAQFGVAVSVNSGSAGARWKYPYLVVFVWMFEVLFLVE
jgi:hypothetical protein